MPRNTAQPRNPHDPAFGPFVEQPEPQEEEARRTPASSASASASRGDDELDKLRRLTVDVPEHTRRRLAAASAAAGTNAKCTLRAFATAVELGDERALSLIDDPRYR